MNKKNLLWSLLTILFASIFSVSFVSCGDDDDNNSNESTITENDPEGTIIMNLVNNDDDIVIDEEWPYMHVGMTPQNNIDTWYYNAQIVSLGKVKGLSAIMKIPESGWAERCAATPGFGYIIRQSKVSAYDARRTDGYKYCRVYLVDFIKSTSGGIMGATIKYQLWNPEQ
ncbi:MAG: DUF5036 family protein [Prevotella sp.]|nr:DUF5036 family protein [Prevotella sp.]